MLLVFALLTFQSYLDIFEFLDKCEEIGLVNKSENTNKVDFSIIYDQYDKIENIAILYILLLLRNDELSCSLPLITHIPKKQEGDLTINYGEQYVFNFYMSVNEWVYEYIRITTILLFKYKILVKFLIPNVSFLPNQNIFIPLNVYFNIDRKKIGNILYKYFQSIEVDLLKICDNEIYNRAIDVLNLQKNMAEKYKLSSMLKVSSPLFFHFKTFNMANFEIIQNPTEIFSFNDRIQFRKLYESKTMLKYLIEPLKKELPILNHNMWFVISLKKKVPVAIYIFFSEYKYCNYNYVSTYLYVYIKYFIMFILNKKVNNRVLENGIEYEIDNFGKLKYENGIYFSE